jgi:hypothetical protein
MTSTQNQAQLAADLAALPVPTRDAAYTEARRQLAKSFRAQEQVWLVGQTFDEPHTSWQLDVVRRGPMGRWVLQRYRFDAQAETLYFSGERFIEGSELSSIRASGSPFDVAAWQSPA